MAAAMLPNEPYKGCHCSFNKTKTCVVSLELQDIKFCKSHRKCKTRGHKF